MTRHRVKQKGLKFYPQWRGWGTLWIWGSFDYWQTKFTLNDQYSDNSRRIYFKTLERAMEYVDEDKKRKVNKNYNM
jgi:hypothetical protein